MENFNNNINMNNSNIVNYEAPAPIYLGEGNINNINDNDDVNEFKLLSDEEDDFNDNENLNYDAAPDLEENIIRDNINNINNANNINNINNANNINNINNINNANNINNENDIYFELVNAKTSIRNLGIEEKSFKRQINSQIDELENYIEGVLKEYFENPIKIKDYAGDYYLDLKKSFNILNENKYEYFEEYDKMSNNYNQNQNSLEVAKKYEQFKKFFVFKLEYEFEKLKKINNILHNLSNIVEYYGRIHGNVPEKTINDSFLKLADEVIELEDVYNLGDLPYYENFKFK